MRVNSGVLVACIILALAGAAMLAYATVHGPAVYSDGVVYLLSADNLVKGDGFGIIWGSGRFHPLAGYPPLYPLLVALVETTGLGVLAAARATAIASFGLTILAVGYLGYMATGSKGLGLSAAAFTLCSPMLFEQYANAGSEGGFYLTGLAGLAVVLLAAQSGKRASWIMGAILTGMGFLSRYVGISLILTGLLWALFAGTSPARRRITDAVIFVGISMGLMLPWLAWAYSATGTIGERAVHSVGDLWSYTEPLRSGLIDIAWGWLPGIGAMEATYRIRGSILVGIWLVVLAVVIGFLVNARRGRLTLPRATRLAKWSGLFLLFGVVYGAVHALAYVTTYPTPDVSERLLTPLYLSGVLAVLGVLWMVPEARPSWRPLLAVPAVIVAVLVLPGIREIPPLARALRSEGGGFTSSYWRSSQTVAMVRGLPEGTPIISNAADALIFLTGRPTYWIPELMMGEPDPGFSRFGDHPERSEEEQVFRYRHAALVVFPWIESQFRQLYGDAGQERTEELTRGLEVYWRAGANEGIYFYPEDGREP